ncbi:G-patch RNA-binding protein, involved in splicing Gpl1 [Schizosaccharomyces osmophilus]|uniref:G-patch RNA-binding protein, involved in splicing Gpl1 n=1 Tax=Schizosaccharomyces osmophilus TaxID=2545709 RepID=A0AAF0AXU9_9SCHI|nr:G-patch RNA-binding protein, involved in splicing Gpl1 [Schizosaccharomyces osmophilus]WBW74104.1 G-patch RNA-binding protein, involved in splicing Gpl1 [Schizosaccharomyces osmophilus]
MYQVNRKRANKELDRHPHCIYGTPVNLEAYLDGHDLPVWKQTARDERNRKRFHGAFTGGFSAGYFNSVGSKEGWQPKAWSSSKKDRGTKTGLSLDDIMDEEDKNDQEMSKVYSIQNDTLERSIPLDDPLLRELGPKQSSIGEKILRNFGWNGRDFVISPTKDFYEREDSAKYNIHGLGYQQDETIHQQKSLNKNVKKKPENQAFGLGVAIDDNEEDEDPYNIGPAKSRFDKSISLKKKNPLSIPTIGKHTFVSKKSRVKTNPSPSATCMDGLPVLAGFVVVYSPENFTNQWFPPPEIPEGWISRFSSPADSPPQTSSFNKSTNSRERSEALFGSVENKPDSQGNPSHTGLSDEQEWRIIDIDTAKHALSRKDNPYTDERAGMYEIFLNAHVQGMPKLLTEMRTHYLSEFAQTASLYRPMSRNLSMRFTSSSGDNSANATAISESTDQASNISSTLSRPRQISDFYPSRLLCKRFHIRPPEVKLDTSVLSSEQPSTEPSYDSLPNVIDKDLTSRPVQVKVSPESLFNAIFGDD